MIEVAIGFLIGALVTGALAASMRAYERARGPEYFVDEQEGAGR